MVNLATPGHTKQCTLRMKKMFTDFADKPDAKRDALSPALQFLDLFPMTDGSATSQHKRRKGVQSSICPMVRLLVIWTQVGAKVHSVGAEHLPD